MNDANLTFEKEMKIKSNKNKEYSLKISFNSQLNIQAKELNKFPEETFFGNFSLEYIIKNKYFSLCENIPDVKLTLEPIMNNIQNIILKEESNELILSFQLPHPLCKEIIFPLQKKEKDTKETIQDLYNLISKLNEKLISQENEINQLKAKLENQENEINQLKKKSKSDCFEKLNNPWSKEYQDKFRYTLKDGDFLAEKTQDNGHIDVIKSQNLFQIGKIYKLEYNGNKMNDNIKIKDREHYTFIIDIGEKKFTLYENLTKIGDYNFTFQENISALAAIRNIGNSVRIKTYEKNKSL